MDLFDIAEDLSSSTDLLYDFLSDYNNYVQNFYDSHDEGCYPVSIMEFYENDFECQY